MSDHSTKFSYAEFTTRNIGFITEADQEKLRAAHVFVAGVGGMGGAAVACLARVGIGRITIADIDVFELSNLNRQIFANLQNLDRPKTEVTAEAIAQINPECVVECLGAEWVEQLDEILPGVTVAINGCDDVRATLALMRRAEAAGRSVVDGFASTLPNVYVVGPNDSRPEQIFGYPSVGVALPDITDEIAQGCAEKEIEYVMVHSSTAEHVELDIAAEMITGKRSRFSFAPMVWSTGCFMAYEAVRVILDKPGSPGPRGVFYNPWTQKAERPKSAPVAWFRRFFVRRFFSGLVEEDTK